MSTAVTLPSNQSAEQGLLGALLIDNRSLDTVSDFLKPEHFFTPAHERIYAAIRIVTSRGENCSATTLMKYFTADADLTAVGGAEYLVDLTTSVVTVHNVSEYAREVFDLYQRRQAILLFSDAISRASNPEPEVQASNIITDVETGLYAIMDGGIDERQTDPFSTSITKAIASAQAAYRGDELSKGITTGLLDVDKRMGRLKRSDLIVIAARPGMGKTALVTGMAWAAARAGYPVAFFSLEMSSEQIATRIISAESGVPGDLIRKGEVHAQQFQRFITASQALASLPLHIADRPARSIAQIRAEARRLKRQHGIKLIIVDYLQLIAAAGNRNNSRVNDITEITGGLKALAKEFDIPVIALSQLSRAVEQREDKRPQLSDLRESGSIEQDSDIVAFVYREEYYLEREEPSRKAGEHDTDFNDRVADWERRKFDAKNKAEFIIGKNRHGPTKTVDLHFDGPTTTFSNAAEERNNRAA